MIRTQVFLPETTYQLLQIQAQKENLPTAQLIRDALDLGIKQLAQNSKDDGWSKLAELQVSGPKDLSKNIDKYLYEK